MALVGAPEGKKSLRRYRYGRENNIKRALQELEWSTEWTDLAQNRGRLQVIMNAVMNLRLP
jgi:hypothetical protein